MLTYLITWVTPTSLFILVNAVIATIAITSHFTADNSNGHRHHLHGGGALLRPPSFLDRVKSFNFSNPDPPTGLDRAPSLLGRLKSITLNRSDSNREPETPPPEEKQSPPEEKQNPPEEKTHHDHSVTRSKSETVTLTPATSLRRRLQKSLSEKLSWAAFTAAETETPGETEEVVSEIERRRPATARQEIGESETPAEGGEEEVDSRADDFINKFKQQLKLQRLESLLRYRETAIKAKKQ